VEPLMQLVCVGVGMWQSFLFIWCVDVVGVVVR
jgi:hypothetical protein